MNAPQERRGQRVLLVEDEEGLLERAGRVLRAEGYEVASARDAGAALRQLTEPRRLDAMIADIVLPDLSGMDLARRARQLRPSAALVITSGYEAIGLAALPEGADFLPKPYTDEELLASLRRVLPLPNPPV